ncbi:PAS domain-containing protein [Pseudoalteromonas sp.]|uniref:PAS domain-containing protein n=1 Tax=Pseudoalteromonas sp. TaxID=53249 RepID=UPI001BCA70CF|nr:PAS domain-containing protein [Pseudoalteromonas sp.]
MQAPKHLPDEKHRLISLEQTQLLDTEVEERFDRLTRLVKLCLGTEIVLISLVDKHRQWFKSKQGLSACETPRDISFCGHAIFNEGIFQISDAHQDPRFADNPLVTGAPNIRFYAGATLFYNQQAIGTLCVIDSHPRSLTEKEQHVLREFADAVELEIKDRLQEEAHQQLAERELRYRSVLEGTRIGTWEWNVQTGETVFNERWAQMLGYTLDELAPVSIETWQSLAHPDDLAQSSALLKSHFNGELDFYDYQCRMKHKQGHWIWVHDRGRVVSWTDTGEPSMMYGTHADITEEKLNKQQLQKQKWLYEQILEQTMAGYWDWYIQDDVEYLSPAFKEMFGYTEDEMPNTPTAWQAIIYPEDLPKVIASFDKHVTSLGEAAFDNIIRYYHKNGSTVWVRCIGKVIEWTADNKPIRMIGSHLNVTDEMCIKEELQQSRDQFQALVSNIPGITYRCLADDSWTMLYMSGSIDPLSGYPADDFINNKVRSYASVIHPEDAPYLDEEMGKAIQNQTSWLLLYRVFHKDGSIRYVEERGMAEYNEDGSVRYLDGFILDVTNERQLKRQLLNLTAQLPGAVYQFQQWPDGRIAFPYASPNIKKIYEVTPEQIKQSANQIFDMILEQDLPDLVSSIEHSAETLTLWQHEYRVKKSNGSIAWVSGRAMPELMPDKSVLWHGYLYDITDTKQHYIALEQANDNLNLAQQRLELSSQQAQIGYWQASLKTGELWWSSMIYDVFGFDEATTQPSVPLFKSTLHPDDAHLVFESEERAKHTGLHDVVHRIIRPDGEIRWVHELAQMLPEENNPDMLMIGSVQDVTERMRLQQMKNDFISTISHELRTPLTSINGALKLIQATQISQLNEKGVKLLNVACSNAERLQHLINDLLDIEKLIAGKMSFELQVNLIKPLLERAVVDHSTYATKSQLVLELVIPDTLKQAQILIDEHRFQQILANLLSNAIKYSPAGGKIQLIVSEVEQTIEIAVKDEGVGIADHFKNKLFQRFSQADASSAKEKGGTGLGLALCKELTEAMNGSIGFDESSTLGATFYVRFPLY